MRAELRSWWQKIKERRVTILVVAIILVVTIALIIVEVKSYGTGFTGKTLWDWFNLIGVLAIPAVVGLGAAWYTAQQGKVSERETRDNQRENTLQDYINKMSELLLEKHLRKSQPNDEVREIARARTITLLPRLDGKRKASVLQFLHESNLITRDKPIVDLNRADLSHVEPELPYQYSVKLYRPDLSHINLHGANLSQAELERANLSNADLREANLQKANLFGADLSYIDLSYADLEGADLRGATLRKTNLSNTILSYADLRGTILDGTIFGGFADLSGVDLSGVDLRGITGITLEKLKEKGAIMSDRSKYA